MKICAALLLSASTVLARADGGVSHSHHSHRHHNHDSSTGTHHTKNFDDIVEEVDHIVHRPVLKHSNAHKQHIAESDVTAGLSFQVPDGRTVTVDARLNLNLVGPDYREVQDHGNGTQTVTTGTFITGG